MKTILLLLSLSGLVLVAPIAAQEESAKELLRDGLFEEEANQDLKKAEAAYLKLIERYDAERRYAGTALFRLAEIARKQKKEELAAGLYRRVALEFADQEELSARARAMVGEEGGASPAVSRVAMGEEGEELDRLTILAMESPDLLDGLDRSGFYPLHQAAANGWTVVIDYLLEQKVTIDARSSVIGMTPLHMAVVHGRLEVVKKLLEAGADHSATFSCKAADLPVPPPGALKDAGGTWTPLHLAVAFDRKEVAAALIAKGSTTGGDEVYAYKLRREGREVGQGEDHSTPLMLAMRLEATPMVELLLEKGADVNQVLWRSDGGTALVYAVEKRKQYVPLLLEHGADPNLGGGAWGYKALYLAAKERDVELVKSLLKAGAKVNDDGQDHDRDTALNVAVVSLPEVIDLLLAAGAKPTVSAMQRAVERGDMELIKKLMAAEKEGAILKEASAQGLLQGATTKEMAELLLSAGVEVDAKGEEGLTALSHLALREDRPEHRELFDFLLAKGADTSAFSGNEADSRVSWTAPPPPRAGDTAKPGIEGTLVPYALEKISYAKRMTPDAVRLAYLNAGRIFDGEELRIAGTPPPTLPELLGREAEFRLSHVLARLRVLRKEGELVREVVVLTEADLRGAALPELQWGDLVEVAIGSGSNTAWLREAPYLYEPRTVTLKPGRWEEKIRIEPTLNVSDTGIDSVFLDYHFPASSRILDLSKLTIRRGEAPPLVLDVREESAVPRIRLLDGDVIEVPVWMPKDNTPRWDGVKVLHPDRPVVEVPPSSVIPVYAPKTLFELLRSAPSWRGGRNLSWVEIIRFSGARHVVGVQALIDEFPEYEWTAAKLGPRDQPLSYGDLVVLHPLPEVDWQTRVGAMPFRRTKLESFLKVLFPDGPGIGTSSSPAAPQPRRRVVLPPTR